MRNSTGDNEYLQMVDRALTKAFDKFQPDFVVYNAGTDCMVGDPLGAAGMHPGFRTMEWHCMDPEAVRGYPRVLED